MDPTNPTSSLANTSQRSLLEKMRYNLEDVSTNSSFACGGALLVNDTGKDTSPPGPQNPVPVTPVTIRYGASGTGCNLILPSVTAKQDIDQLMTKCQPATFGRGGEDVYDETYRKALKMDTTEFCTDFCPYATGIIDTVTQILLPQVWQASSISSQNRGIRAELYKLNAYSAPSGMFKPHVDTPRASSQIGSLVVSLPSPFEGMNVPTSSF